MVTTNFETPAGHASLSNITNGFQMFPNGWVSSSWPSKWSSLLTKQSNLLELLLLKQLIPARYCQKLLKKFQSGL